MSPDAIVYCGAAALAWNPGFVDVAREQALAVLAVEDPTTRYAGSPAVAAAAAGLAWARPDDAGQVLAQVGRWGDDFRIRGVCALREEWVGTAALLADWLGTPSIGLRAARVCRDKALQRVCLEPWSPRSWTVSPDDRERIGTWPSFPAVVKPAQGSAGVGVRQVHDAEGLRAYLEAAPAAQTILIEERVVGAEYSVESLVQCGAVVFAEITAKRTNETGGNTFVELAHTVPASLPAAHRQSLLQANAAIVRRLAVADGILHTEYRVDSEGRSVLMEVNARCPGGSIPALYQLSTGTRLEEVIVGVAVGDPVKVQPPARHARQIYLDHPQGTLRAVRVDSADVGPTWLTEAGTRAGLRPLDPAAPPRLHAVTVIKARGDRLGALVDNRDRAVTIIIDGPTADELDRYEDEVIPAIQIIVEEER